MKIRNLILGLFCLAVSFSCSEEDLEPSLKQDKSIEMSINSVGDLQAVLNAAYDYLSEETYYGRDVIILGEVFSDNATSNANSNRFVTEAEMNLTPTSAVPEDFWKTAYEAIAQANIIIGAKDISGNEAQIDHIKGQAYAIRALAHFDLVRFYGQQHVNNGGMSAMGVPYVTTFRDNDALFPARNTVQEVKEMAYQDLETAESLMSESLNDLSKEFFTTHAVNALEARIANYFGDWQRSLDAAEEVINSSAFEIAAENEFIATFANDAAVNSIFEIAANEIDNQGIEGLANIYQDTNYGDVIALPNLAAIYGEGDVRGPGGIITVDAGTVRNTGKYPSIAPYDDNISIFRYEEIILIYAEALFHTGNTPEASRWLNMIPANRGAALYDEATIENILLERRKELAFEGFRFHDLARTGEDIPLPDPVLQTHGGPEYGNYNYAMPIPAAESQTNSNVPQNFGYE